MKKRLIVIAGNLAVGKTTLANLLGTEMDWFIGQESVIDNPYLSDYYSDMGRWAYHLQIYFLGNRINLYKEACDQNKTAILDRSIFEDAEIFAKSLYKNKIINSRDYNSYMSLYNYLISSLPAPDLMIYIKAPIEIILNRIIERGQPFDKHINRSYIKMINDYYEKWVYKFSLCPFITLDSEEINYRDNAAKLQYVKELVLSKIIIV